MKKLYYEYDVAVVGGGPAGLSAAISAGREGARVILLESSSFLGGAMAIGLSPLGFLDQSGEKCIGGFGEEFIAREQTTPRAIQITETRVTALRRFILNSSTNT